MSEPVSDSIDTSELGACVRRDERLRHQVFVDAAVVREQLPPTPEIEHTAPGGSFHGIALATQRCMGGQCAPASVELVQGREGRAGS